MFFSLGIENKFKSLQSEIGIGVSTIGAGIVPSRSWMVAPIGSIGRCRPYNHRIPQLATSTYAFDRVEAQDGEQV